MLIKRIIFSCLILSANQAAAENQIIGEGKWKFEFLPNGISLPTKHIANVQDYHGVAVDSKGRVYVAYYSNKQTNETRTVARFNYTPDAKSPFTFDRFLGDLSWVDGRVHGLNITKNDKGEERLLLVYNKK